MTPEHATLVEEEELGKRAHPWDGPDPGKLCTLVLTDLHAPGRKDSKVRSGRKCPGTTRWSLAEPVSAPPEDLLGPTQAPSAFLVFVQHMSANDSIPCLY